MSGGKPITVPYGERGGLLVHVSDVERGLACNCVCPNCQGDLVARKGKKARHHFAHYKPTDCSSETLMHHLGKRILHRRITRAIAGGEAMPMTWSCSGCIDEHVGNLIKLAVDVRLETNLGSCRPDMTLFNSEGLPVVLVEIVVSHRPDENVREFSRKARLPIVEFHISAAEGIEQLDTADVLKPAAVNICTRPKCKMCGNPLDRKNLHVVTGPCWKCKSPMKIAIMDVDGHTLGPASFSDEDIAMARRYGVILKENYSNTVRSSYVSNTCPRCGAFVGAFYLHDYWYLMTPETSHPAGFECSSCDIG